MKRLLFFSCLVLGLMAAVSCKKEHDGTSSEQFYPCNDSDVLLHRVLAMDETGAIAGARGGLLLDEADPGKVAIIAENYQEATDWFNQILPDYATVITNGEDVIWNMRDTLGVSQGQAVLKPVSGKPDDRIAEVEVPVSARPLSGIVFIPRSAMPLNDDELSDKESCDALDPYYLGAKIEVREGKLPEGTTCLSGFLRGEGDFVVIQEYTVGAKDGILLRLEPGEQNYMSPYVDEKKHKNRCSTEWTLDYVHSILKANPSLHSNIKAMGMVDWDHWFMCDRGASKTYRYHLKNGGKIEELGLFSSWYYYEAWVYRFYVSWSRGGQYRVYLEVADWGYNEHHN